MSNATAGALQEQSAPAVGQVFQALVADIASGKYASGSRLPAERELSRMMGASRPTLREALRRMSEWGLVEARRGSGVVVLHRRSWSIEVLPAFLLHGQFGNGGPTMGRVMSDLLDLRRMMLPNLVRQAALRVTRQGLAKAREAMHGAWENRDDVLTFAALDLQIFSLLFESAEMLPSLWLLNSIGRVYKDLAPTLGAAISLPEDYVESHTLVLDAIEDRNPEGAANLLRAYFERTDKRLSTLLGALGA